MYNFAFRPFHHVYPNAFLVKFQQCKMLSVYKIAKYAWAKNKIKK